MLGDRTRAQEGLGQLKAAFGQFGANKQKFPLYYESEYCPFSSYSVF